MPKLSTVAIRVPVEHIREMEPFRPSGYFEEVMDAGQLDGDAVLIPVPAWSELRKKYGGQPLSVPVPVETSGLGTFISKLFGFFGIKKCCRCTQRQSILDRLFPPSYFREPLTLLTAAVWIFLILKMLL